MYTGNFQSYQGLDLLLKSAKIVKEHDPNVSSIIVGGDPQQVECWRNQSSAYGLDDSVLFTGTVPLAEAIAYSDGRCLPGVDRSAVRGYNLVRPQFSDWQAGSRFRLLCDHVMLCLRSGLASFLARQRDFWLPAVAQSQVRERKTLPG